MTLATLEHKPEIHPHDLPPKHLPWVYCKNPACGHVIPWKGKTPSQYARAQGCCPECSKIISIANQRKFYQGERRPLYGKTVNTEKTKSDIEFNPGAGKIPKAGKFMVIPDAEYEKKIDGLLGIEFADHRGF